MRLRLQYICVCVLLECVCWVYMLCECVCLKYFVVKRHHYYVLVSFVLLVTRCECLLHVSALVCVRD